MVSAHISFCSITNHSKAYLLETISLAHNSGLTGFCVWSRLTWLISARLPRMFVVSWWQLGDQDGVTHREVWAWRAVVGTTQLRATCLSLGFLLQQSQDSKNTSRRYRTLEPWAQIHSHYSSCVLLVKASHEASPDSSGGQLDSSSQEDL